MRRFTITTGRIVQIGISFAALIGLSQFFVSNVAAASLQPAGLTLPMAIAGQKYSEPLVLTGFGLSGCYRIVVKDAAPGFTISPTTACTTNAAGLKAHITGTASTKDHTISSTTNILIDAIPIDAKAPTGAWTVQLPIIPRASFTPSLKTMSFDLSYSGTTLNHVSCPIANDCFVTGTSGNPSAPPTKHPTRVTYIKQHVAGSKSLINLLPAGGFVALLLSPNPVKLLIMEDAIPATINSFSCSSTTQCFMVGHSVSGWPWAASLNTADKVLSQRSFMHFGSMYQSGTLNSVSCLPNSECVSVGALTLLHPSGKRTTDAMAIRLVQTGTPRITTKHIFTQWASLTGVSCSTSSYCVAVGTQVPGNGIGGALIISTNDGGGHWIQVQAVKCFSTGLKTCTKLAEPVWTHVDGPFQYGPLSAVGCIPGHTNHCTVEWAGFQQLATSTDGHHWIEDLIADPLNTQPLGAERGFPGIGALSCAPNGHCFVTTTSVTGNIGGTYTSVSILESVGAKVPVWGLAGWAALPLNLSLSLNGISCPTQTSCVAVGGWVPLVGLGKVPVGMPFVMGDSRALHPMIVPPPSIWDQLEPAIPVMLAIVSLTLALFTGGASAVGVESFFTAANLTVTLIAFAWNIVGLMQGHNVPLNLAGLSIDSLAFVKWGGIGSVAWSFHTLSQWLNSM